MLQIPFIRNNQELVLEGLAKRNFVNAKEIIERVLETDKTRRNIQVLLDNTLAESNAISKEIGILFKTGQIQKAALAKEKSKKLKDQSKNFTDHLPVTLRSHGGHPAFSSRFRPVILRLCNDQRRLTSARVSFLPWCLNSDSRISEMKVEASVSSWMAAPVSGSANSDVAARDCRSPMRSWIFIRASSTSEHVKAELNSSEISHWLNLSRFDRS